MRTHVEVHQRQKKENITHIGDCTYLCYRLILKRGFAHKNKNTNNTSAIGQYLNMDMNVLLWECGSLNSTPL